MNLSSVRSRHAPRWRPVRAPSRRSAAAHGCPLALDVGGDGSQVGRGTDDDAHRHVDVEDIVQQVRKRQRRQRVSTEIEVRVRLQVGGRRAQ